MSTPKINWFTDWFNTKYYHILYKDRSYDEADAFINKLISHLDPQTDSRFWDLCCGKGRHSIAINKLGYEVIGTDLSEKSIKAAKENENKTLQFFKHDMRNPFYINYFNYVFNLFTSFGYFQYDKDEQKVIDSVYNALKPNGIFILDYFNVNCVLAKHIHNEEKNINGIIFNITKNIDQKRIIKTIDITDGEEKHQFTESVKLLSLTDFEKYAAKSGLKIDTVYGNYNLDAFNESTSDRLILKLKK